MTSQSNKWRMAARRCLMVGADKVCVCSSIQAATCSGCTCATCGHAGEKRVAGGSNDGETATCAACGAPVTLDGTLKMLVVWLLQQLRCPAAPCLVLRSRFDRHRDMTRDPASTDLPL